jgi:hypothetical protein
MKINLPNVELLALVSSQYQHIGYTDEEPDEESHHVLDVFHRKNKTIKPPKFSTGTSRSVSANPSHVPADGSHGRAADHSRPHIPANRSHSLVPECVPADCSHSCVLESVPADRSHSRVPESVPADCSYSLVPERVPADRSHSRVPECVPADRSHSCVPERVPADCSHSHVFPDCSRIQVGRPHSRMSAAPALAAHSHHSNVPTDCSRSHAPSTTNQDITD